MIVKDLITKLEVMNPDQKVFIEGQTHYSEVENVEEGLIGLLPGVVIRYNT